MRGRSAESWNVSKERYQQWLGTRGALLSPAIDLSNASAKSLGALALLDNPHTYLSYEDIQSEIIRRRVISPTSGSGDLGAIPILTLRVAMSELGRLLRRTQHRYQLRIAKFGRISRFQFVQPYQIELLANLAPSPQMKPASYRDPINDPRTIAKTLVQNGGGLPFSSFYAIFRAAATWVYFSTTTSMLKRNYEGDSIHRLGTFDRLGGKRVSLIGLAVGEGFGEAEILDSLLNAKDPKARVSVDYLAVDSSDVLLLGHTKLITERFSEHIERGTLKFVPVLGDMYHLAQHLTRERALQGVEFLSSKNVACSYFGNCLGNDENREWDFFRTIFAAFPSSQQVELLVGVSLLRYAKRNQVAEEKYSLHPFLLETPRHLMHDLGLLKSTTNTGRVLSSKDNREFTFAALEKQPSKLMASQSYLPATGIRGRVYRFKYQLRNRLVDYSRTGAIERGGYLTLFSIVKYDLKSLTDFLIARGLIVNQGGINDILTIGEGDEVFRYSIFSVIRPRFPDLSSDSIS